MQRHDVIVVGASAGGVEALITVIRGLPERLAASVLVVLHVPAWASSSLPGILQRLTRLRVSHARDGAKLERGCVLVAPPDHHLTVEGERVRVGRGPCVNGHRPAVDPLFWTAARSLGPRVVGVVLSGALDDGAVGMLAVKAAGGVTVVQAPEAALYPSMPSSVLELTEVDHVLPTEQIAPCLAALAGSAPPSPAEPRPLRELAWTLPDDDLEGELALSGEPSELACHWGRGALWRLKTELLQIGAPQRAELVRKLLDRGRGDKRAAGTPKRHDDA